MLSETERLWFYYLFLYYSETIRKRLLGSCHTGKLSPAKLADSVYRQFSTTKIFPVVIEFHFHGTCGASDKGSRFYLKSNLKKHSLSEFLDFSIKKLVHKGILYKKVADVFCNISFTKTRWRELLKIVTTFFHLLPLVAALYSCLFPRNQVLLTSTNRLYKTDLSRFYSRMYAYHCST